MRIRGWPLVATLTVLLNLAGSPARRSSSAAPARDDPPATLLDTLLARHQFDSVQTIAAEQIPRAIAARDSASACALLIARGRAEMLTGDLRGAYDTFVIAAEWAQASRDTSVWMDALRGRAYTAAGLGKGSESSDYYRRMLELARLRGDSTREAQALTGVAYLAMLGGDLSAARADYVKAIRLFRSEDDRVDELIPLVGLGRVYSSLGQIDSARACFQRVWVAATEINQPVEAAHALNNLGTIEHRYGSISLAISYYQRAFDLHRASGETAGAITAGSNLGLARQGCGHYDESAETQEQLLKICNAAGLRPTAGTVLKNLGFAHLSARRISTARACFRRALALGDTLDKRTRLDAVFGLTDAVGIDSLGAAIAVLRREIARNAGGDLTVDTIARLALARHLMDHGDFDAARDEARRALRATAPLPLGSVRSMALLVASSCYRQTGDVDSAMALFERGVADMRAWSESDRTGKLMADLERGAEILLQHPPDRPLRERQAAFFDVLEEFRTTFRVHQVSDPRQKTERVAGAVTLRQLQNDILAPGDLLIEYFVTWVGACAFAASRDTVLFVKFPGGQGSLIARQAADYCGAAAERPHGNALSEADMVESQLALGQALLGPVAGLVARADRIMIVPDGYLHAVPFGSLALPDSDGHPAMLLEHAVVFELPSASALMDPRRTDSTHENDHPFFVFAGGGEGERSLPGAWDEAQTIERRYAGTVECRGPIASRDLCDRMQASGIIHLAAHIDVNEQNPWYSGIQVGNVAVSESPALVRSSPTEEFAILSVADSLRVTRTFAPDAYLRASEIAHLSLDARLAVLSGCESALGLLTVGGGVLGLSAAFMQAGVPTVVGSLWPIDDRTTVDLMRGFYDRLADGMSIAEALRGAQLELRSRPRTAHPFHWAGFVVIGDGRATVPVARKASVVPGMTLAAVLLLLMATGWVFARRRRESRRPL